MCCFWDPNSKSRYSYIRREPHGWDPVKQWRSPTLLGKSSLILLDSKLQIPFILVIRPWAERKTFNIYSTSDAAGSLHTTLSYFVLVISLWNTLYYLHLQFLQYPMLLFTFSGFIYPVPATQNGLVPALCLTNPYLFFRSHHSCYYLREAFLTP